MSVLDKKKLLHLPFKLPTIDIAQKNDVEYEIPLFVLHKNYHKCLNLKYRNRNEGYLVWTTGKVKGNN